jgi:hypothetical protein
MHLQLSKTIEDEKPILLWVGDDIYKRGGLYQTINYI